MQRRAASCTRPGSRRKSLKALGWPEILDYKRAEATPPTLDRSTHDRRRPADTPLAMSPGARCCCFVVGFRGPSNLEPKPWFDHSSHSRIHLHPNVCGQNLSNWPINVTEIQVQLCDRLLRQLRTFCDGPKCCPLKLARDKRIRAVGSVQCCVCLYALLSASLEPKTAED